MNTPNEFHLIFGLRPDFGGKPFALIHYLTVVSCYYVNKPNRINFYYMHEPTGIWWERAKPYLTLIPIQPPKEIFGNPIFHHAHMADVLRLQILLEKGGIYIDMDVLCLRPFKHLQDFDMVLGEEFGVGLCNAVILAKPGAEFLQRWLAAYKSFSHDDWNSHSVRLPRQLADEMPEHIHVVNHRKFFWPMYWREHLLEFFLRPGSSFSKESYCVHLWESITWHFHLGQLTPDQIWELNSEFCLLARPYIKSEWLSPGFRAKLGRAAP